MSTPASPRQLAWLGEQITQWQADGVVTAEQAATINARYSASRRFGVAAGVLSLGGVFVGVGVIWLVAANFDLLSPLARFAVVSAFWLGFTAAAEGLASRRAHGSGRIPSPVVGAFRLIAALVFGAVIFQAAQSLQVPAYEPRLVWLWGAGAVIYAYAVSAAPPLLVGVVALAAGLAWQIGWSLPDPGLVIVGIALLGSIAVGLGALHQSHRPVFAATWREPGAVLLLTGLFAAAVPFAAFDTETSGPGWWLAALAVVTVGVAVFAAVRTSDWTRWEPSAGLVIVGISLVLLLWETSTSTVGAGEWAHAALAVISYLLAAAGVVLLGVQHDSWRLSAIATLALVVFTTFQAFAVFGQIIQGAWLFLFVGVVFLGTGFLFDQGRRRLATELSNPADKG